MADEDAHTMSEKPSNVQVRLTIQEEMLKVYRIVLVG